MSLSVLELAEKYPLTDKVYSISDEDGEIFRFGMTRTGVLTREVFVWLIPGRNLRTPKLRGAIRLWLDGMKGWRFIYAGVHKQDFRAQRFADFFGFTRLGDYNEEHYFYGLRNDPDGTERRDERRLWSDWTSARDRWRESGRASWDIPKRDSEESGDARGI
jgi:hypothetical protein